MCNRLAFHEQIIFYTSAVLLTLSNSFQIGLRVLAITLVVGSVNPYLLLVSGFILFVFYMLRIVYLSTSRNVKRIEGVSKYVIL